VDDELEELRLWEIAKEIGVVCKNCEDNICSSWLDRGMG